MLRKGLSIAGSDCSGGAGIQADLKTFSAFGIYGMSVITSVVAENTCGVFRSFSIPPDIVTAQLSAVFTDIYPDTVKIGMIPTSDCAGAVGAALEKFTPANVVTDPVMAATDGHRLMREDTLHIYRKEIIPRTKIFTPNIPEAEIFYGKPIGSTYQIKEAAKAIYAQGAATVLIKGGHAKGDAVDLFYDGSGFIEFPARRIDTKNTHGTGCTLSSAVAAGLAKGKSAADAISDAKNYITNAIAHALPLGKGHGPLNHFYSAKEIDYEL